MQPLGGAAGEPNRSTNLTATYMKTITDRLGVVIEETYTGIGQSGAGDSVGLAEPRRRDQVSRRQRFRARVPADPRARPRNRRYRRHARRRLVLRGDVGDLDIGYLRPLAVTGLTGVLIADAAPRPDLVTNRLVIEYSIPYLQSKVHSFDLPEAIRNTTPMTEILFTSPAGKSYGQRTTALIAPGISYAGEGWEFAVEALIPASRATGSGVGVTAQFHVALDFLFSDTVGKPIFSTP